jgi:glycosyltransferase involved in cell wall biosynthesis
MVERGRGVTEPVPTSLDVSAIPVQPAGAGRYVLELARALGRRDDVALTVVCRNGDAARWHRVTPASRVLEAVWAPRTLRLFYEQWRLGPVVAGLTHPAIAVHHGPHYTFPHGLGHVASAVTVHDLTFFDHPEWHEATKVRFFQRALRRAAGEADVILCVSGTTAERLRTLLSPKGAIFVAPHGVDHGRFHPGGDEDGGPAEDSRLLAKTGLPAGAEYVLHLATIEPRKGVTDLVRAFDLVAAGHHDLQLVLAGIDGWGSAEVKRAIADCRHGDRVRRLGYVDDEVVPALLRGARVVAYPSYEEGFGLTALEALACGAPLVTTAGTAMAEVAGRAAWTVIPGDEAALAATIEEVLTAGGAELGRRRREGLERAAGFTWERAAATHVAAYRAAAAT